MKNKLKGDVVRLEIDQDNKDLLHVGVRFTVSSLRDLETWREKFGESVDFFLEDVK